MYYCTNPTSLTQPVWDIGDPGTPQDQIDWISITNGGGAGGTFDLVLPGVAQGQTLPPVDSGVTWTFPIGFNPTIDQSKQIQNDLNSLLYITNQGGLGSVVVTRNSGSNGTTTAIYDIEFTGTLGLSPQPLISVGDPTNQIHPVSWGDVGNGGQPGGGADSESKGEFPSLTNGDDANIKFSVGAVGATLVGGTTIYASVSNLVGEPEQGNGVYVTVDGGLQWNLVKTAPPNYMSGQGNYDNAIIAQNATTVFIGGSVNSAVTLDGDIYETTDGGNSWPNDLSILSNTGPHTSQHAFAFDSKGNLLIGNDGGIWRLDAATTSWTDLNGDLATSEIDGVSPDPTNVVTAFAGSQSNGTEEFNNALDWAMVDDTAGGLMGGGQVYVDPNDPNNVYAVQQQLGADAIVRYSGDGGANWSTIFTSFSANIPLVVDPINSDRILVGGGVAGGLFESTQQGAPGTYTNLFPFAGAVTAVGIAQYQGPFVADPNFPDVTDQGANTYDPNTIYITNGSSVFVTKDHAVQWVDITNGAPFSSIGQLVVDPTNRDTVYAIQNTFGAGQIFVNSDATGGSWVEIGNALGLPEVPIWSLVVDPRNGNLYAGTDLGVYELQNSATAINEINNGLTPTVFWQRFGEGMPNVQTHVLVLNQTTNTLLAGTYGRSVFELFLDGQQTAAVPVTAAVVAASGESEWTGPITLVGTTANPVVLGADGNSAVQDPLSTAELNFLGIISDQTANSDPALVKTGLGFIELSGPNTYGGVTDIEEGALIANNPEALGDTVNGTVVSAGAALDLQSSIDAEPLELFGDGTGLGFNGHNTGALESISNSNTYAGPITLETETTIGVASKSTLTITGQISDNGGARSLTKELTGSLVFDEASGNSNTYTGTTYVDQGVLQIASGYALTSASTTVVLDGAQIQLQTPTNPSDPNFSLPATGFGTLTLSGTGINSTGALLDTGGTNTWEGNIVLDANAGVSPITTPAGLVAIGVANPMDMLFIGTLSLPGVGIISDDPRGDGLKSGLQIVGAGTVVLTQDDTYAGTTYVTSGTLQIQDPGRHLGGAPRTTTRSRTRSSASRSSIHRTILSA